ncbi:MAG: glycosyl transferase family 1 [Chloroflexi bacterium RBG_16_48_8]|nr:MAG: glycosyl transferase family 1 [Chloroflexi bacterium RBG_16_48_8]
MRLLYTLTAYPPSIGGAQIHQHELARRLKDRHVIRVISHWDSNRTDWLLGTTIFAPSEEYHYEIDNIPVLRMGFSLREKISLIPSTFLYYFAMDYCIPRISAKIRTRIAPIAKECDIIHNVRIGREPISFASWEVARQQDIPFVFTPVHHPRWKGYRNRAFLRLCRHSDGIIALTGSEKETMVSEGIPPEKIFITGIGPVLSDRADPIGFRYKNEIDGPMVLFLGQHYRYKGYLKVLRAAKIVWERFPEVHFVFIGPPVGDSERHFAQGKDRRVHRLGIVGLQEKTHALSACDILCVPSTQESFGGIYSEAWSFGKPVIGCPIPAVQEVISDGEDGLLVRQEEHDIADKLEFLLSHPSEAEKYGQAGKQKVISRFSWDHIASLTEQAYMKILGRSHH